MERELESLRLQLAASKRECSDADATVEALEAQLFRLQLQAAGEAVPPAPRLGVMREQAGCSPSRLSVSLQTGAHQPVVELGLDHA